MHIVRPHPVTWAIDISYRSSPKYLDHQVGIHHRWSVRRVETFWGAVSMVFPFETVPWVFRQAPRVCSGKKCFLCSKEGKLCWGLNRDNFEHIVESGAISGTPQGRLHHQPSIRESFEHFITTQHSVGNAPGKITSSRDNVHDSTAV